MQKWLVVVPVVALIGAVGAGCGSGGDSTTVIREAAPAAEPSAKASSTPAPSKSQRPTGPPVDVVGLPLDAAEELLRKQGYKAAATNTDTTFGIIDPSNYTVCTQDDPRGNLVPMLAQKYGC